ncbi:TRAP transporter small permease [Sulfitobacter sp. S190]|uniref:TRAP transporter small permease n=1 Tax=Sulfitobacter sp. S190 TaxID=2867022 RepID=UPI0021A2819A|nr:TRAP transporter small permease [Sulfitobacter sp. S190]UWR22127.1 TRAP transporter small permease [Sulfitobacter sp. S190]
MPDAQHHKRERGRLTSFATRLDQQLLKLTGGLAIFGMCALVVAIAVVVGDIIWRRAGGGSFIGSVDLTQFSVMIAVSMAIPYAFATGGHVSVDLLTRSLSPRANRILDVCASLAGVAITGFLCWLTAGRASEIWAYGDVSQDLALPMIWFWSALVAGLALSSVVCTVRALRLTLTGTH